VGKNSAQSLHRCHTHTVVHRDAKPATIVLLDVGRAGRDDEVSGTALPITL
jgi:hypothetical protein